MAVSFTHVELKFLVQKSFSLTLQPLRPTLAKVKKTYEEYRHFNALVMMLLVRKIPKMKLLLSCLLWLYLQPVGSQEAQKMLPARGTACIFSRLCPIVTTVCFTFYFFCSPNQSQVLAATALSLNSSKQETKDQRGCRKQPYQIQQNLLDLNSTMYSSHIKHVITFTSGSITSLYCWYLLEQSAILQLSTISDKHPIRQLVTLLLERTSSRQDLGTTLSRTYCPLQTKTGATCLVGVRFLSFLTLIDRMSILQQIYGR